MKSYKIETKNKVTGSWDDVLSIKPEYVVSTTRIYPLKRLFIPLEIGVIKNLRDAEDVAQERAVKHAKSMYRFVPCRITETTQQNGVKHNSVVWQNGKDTTPPGTLLGKLWKWLNE